MGSFPESRAHAEAEVNKPPGIRFIEHIKGSPLSFRNLQAIVLVLTFFSYACYHATRKTASIVKGALDASSSHLSSSPWPRTLFPRSLHGGQDDGWAPFDGPDSRALLGEMDVAFLSVYSLGIYFAGHLGDRLDLRAFLAVGMAGTGLFTSLFGAGYWLNVHSFYYYLLVQMVAGLFQSTGWPSVVAVVGRWCGKGNRGLVMGVWNAHTSVGNITGSLVAAALLRHGWGWSFLAPGLLIAAMGVVVFVFLPVSPRGIAKEEDTVVKHSEINSKAMAAEPLLEEEGSQGKEEAVGFMEAWRIPGVATFALCLFFSKLVAYTFLYWLPFYISQIAIDGEHLTDSMAGTLSTLFDVGGVAGGILAGHISDRLGARAITAAVFVYCSIPALFFYRVYGGSSLCWNATLMLVAGAFVNGPNALITTVVSADLGAGASQLGRRPPRAMATVTAIIDGTGSVGAALGPLLTGYVSARSWDGVFTMLMGAAFVAGLLLTRLVVAEVAAKIEASRSRAGGSPLAMQV